MHFLPSAELSHRRVYKTSNFSFAKPLLLPPSQCTGSTLISEDSSEIAFLLVENYQLTASVGLRIGREYLDTLCSALAASTIIIFSSDVWPATRCWMLEKRLSECGCWFVKATTPPARSAACCVIVVGVMVTPRQATTPFGCGDL